MQLNFDDNHEDDSIILDESSNTDNVDDVDDTEKISIDEDEELNDSEEIISDLGEDGYDFTKEQKLKKMLLGSVGGAIGLVAVALVLSISALSGTRNSQKEIKKWVAEYLNEQLDGKGVSEGDIEGLTTDLNYLLGETFGTKDLDFSELTPDQIQTLMEKMNSTLAMLPEEDRTKIVDGLIYGYSSKLTGTDLTQSAGYEDLVNRLNDLEYNDKQLATAITNASGVKGEKGDKGDKGDMGERGVQGAQGMTGAQGATGLQGAQGMKGDKGDKGDQGAQGVQGLQGSKGDKGDKGDQGLQGIQGEKGSDGKDGKSLFDIAKELGKTNANDENEYLNELDEKYKGDSAHTIYVIEDPDGKTYLTDDISNLPAGDHVIGQTVITVSDADWDKIMKEIQKAGKNTDLNSLLAGLDLNGVDTTVIKNITNVNNYTTGVMIEYGTESDGTPKVTIKAVQ